MNRAIKFGTDGWRAIIAKEYTVEGVLRVTEGVASWLKANNFGSGRNRLRLQIWGTYVCHCHCHRFMQIRHRSTS